MKSNLRANSSVYVPGRRIVPKRKRIQGRGCIICVCAVAVYGLDGFDRGGLRVRVYARVNGIRVRRGIRETRRRRYTVLDRFDAA